MSQKQRVSVIIPVFNGTNYFEEALNSVFAQTYENYEIIVIDDGSTDGTWDLIQKYNYKIRSFRKENGGTASALNFGIKHASGEFICWLSHDDMFLPDKIAKQLEFMIRNPQYAFSYTDYIVIDSHGVELYRKTRPWFERTEMLRQLFLDCHIHGCTTMIRKEVFDKVGFFSEELKYTQDLEMWMRILRYFEIGKLSIFSIKYRTYEQQGSRNIRELFQEQKKMHERIFIDIQKSGWSIEENKTNNFNRYKEFIWFADAMTKNKYAFPLSLKYYLKALSMISIQNNVLVLKKIFLLFFNKAVTFKVFFLRKIKRIVLMVLKGLGLLQK